jgi:transposase
MPDVIGEQDSPKITAVKPLFTGSIHYYFKGNIEYANFEKDEAERIKSKDTKDDYLGRVVNKEEGLFFSNKRGYFHFSLEKGFTFRHDLVPDNRPESDRLRYGDIWVYQEILRTTGFGRVIEKILPDCNDSLNALIAFRLSDFGAAYSYASDWYDESYAKVIFPKAAVSSASVSKFMEKLGDEHNYRQFTEYYLEFINKNRCLSEMKEYPILIDSTGLPNSSNIDMTATSNHSGEINNEIRLIYVVDSESGLPIFFKPIAGNITDNKTLKTTLRLLKANNINVKLSIMDAGYSNKKNLEFLNSLEIPFLTRLADNLKEVKQLTKENGHDLLFDLSKLVEQNNRMIYCKQVPVKIDDNEYWAYICLDTEKFLNSFKSFYGSVNINEIQNINNDDLNKLNEDYRHKFNGFGIFVLISNTNIPYKDVIAKYYTRQRIEQIFDVGKNYAGLLPVRSHYVETFRGHLMMTFIITVINLLINKSLKDVKLNPFSVFHSMRGLYINVFSDTCIIDEPRKHMSDVIDSLDLKTKFEIEKRDTKNTNLNPNRTRRKKGRPKGSLGKPKEFKQVEVISDIDDNNCPKISDGEQYQNQSATTSEQKRSRGRPKGSLNKPKEENKSTQIPEKRSRGRPKGSLNKPKE